MIDVVVIGAGIHGCHAAATLLRRGMRSDALRLLDDQPEPLACWRRNTTRIGMRRLRSGVLHDIDPRPLGLHHFAESRGQTTDHDFAGPERRPSLALFDAHADFIVESAGLRALHECVRVTAIHRDRDNWCVCARDQQWIARRVILAIGRGRPRWPVWARRLAQRRARVGHVFDAVAPRHSIGAGRLVVVGGGLSATQLAVTCAARNPGRVVLVRRRMPKIEPFDAGLAWAGTRRLPWFESLALGHRRRSTKDEAMQDARVLDLALPTKSGLGFALLDELRSPFRLPHVRRRTPQERCVLLARISAWLPYGSQCLAVVEWIARDTRRRSHSTIIVMRSSAGMLRRVVVPKPAEQIVRGDWHDAG